VRDECDPDDDGDAVPDPDDLCPLVANPDQADCDGDQLGDACDDEHPGALELCNGVDDDCNGKPDGGEPDTDLDGVRDECDPDKDGDGVSDQDDTCPLAADPDQADCDQDQLGDACDQDDDDDFWPDAFDCEECNPNAYPGFPELCDDLDNDCDGDIDGIQEGCYEGTLGTQGMGTCVGGIRTCTTGDWGACVGQVVDVEEICGNPLDDDCDGAINDGCLPQAVDFTFLGWVLDAPSPAPGTWGVTAAAGQPGPVGASQAAPGAGFSVDFGLIPVRLGE
jgi:hypothetical protein